MTAPNRNTLWAETLLDELVAGGVEAVCVAPGSRSTPLTVAADAHPDLTVFSHFDERSAAYFALGRARRTGEPTPLICTSGTAAANFHPAVIEASQARVPMVLLTADRPPELRDSGANQTIDQEKLYGDAVRWFRDLPEPEPTGRKLRRLRTDAARALAESTGVPAGPVHLNVPFRKPLEPVEVSGDVPDDLPEREPLGAEGRDGPFVRTTGGRPTLDDAALDRLTGALADAERALIVAGPADPSTAAVDGATAADTAAADASDATASPGVDADAVSRLATATNAPVLADPLSGLRFGPHVDTAPVLGGYDGYLDDRVVGGWPDPDVVVRFGASPTSKPLRNYLADADARQFLVDPAGEWRDATFTATDLVAADPDRTVRALADRLSGADAAAQSAGDWRDRWLDAEREYWRAVDELGADDLYEGAVVADAVERAPDPATVFVSNSMPVRDLDRFGRPRDAALSVLGNRGASGIDGIESTALGAGSATDDPLVLVTGDLAFYHDMNGLLAVARCGVDATVVLINNDGGGIFHLLPIEDFDPPFTEQFKTPHGIDFAPTGDLYGLDFARVETLPAFRDAYDASLDADGAQVIEFRIDGEASHRTREAIHDAVCERLGQ
ncbi:2-succinyl-5-enolpyruvyl-6-hydroxy-3-cyclohexene-1-carboxylate synthase [Natronoarchaeum philippinense]|uniref:2-succinyl-5-enolpyruvyl-6-hydroxy-3-cyclohexene-1-carboxylate synthase n=1 Tax=Natronoarchaeum philippinense TaxID=558529 RepID=A0A285N7W4_NATPI|nr:2-succinyl-5-enolpyruvyl-6-hydroxy-3-cyclohexene-1-carboxylic-acid synthase [Natronoarchaeum philippinense]SNZ04967.1 2-succinyl-5-enolpyruvyl-6-hydroxy-3-cyclohexene-1-carboxylate synthase [Natronoarchaeum philippinense]